MKSIIQSFINSLHESIRIINQFSISASEYEIKHVVLAGSGISHIAALLTESFIQHEIRVPLTVNNGFRIPGYVNEHTLFIANSFSGTTEETLEQVKRALARKAKIVCISTGGTMRTLALENQLDFIQIPSANSKLRKISLSYTILLTLAVMQKSDLISNNYLNEVLAAHRFLVAASKKIQADAKKLASLLAGKFLVLYGSVKIEAVVLRAQQQINENSKVLCHANFFPEILHNEVEAWGFADQKIFKECYVLFLRHTYEHPLTRMGIELIKAPIMKNHVPIHELVASGNSYMEQCFYFIHFFDWLSYYISQTIGTDPENIPLIQDLKQKIRVQPV